MKSNHIWAVIIILSSVFYHTSCEPKEEVSEPMFEILDTPLIINSGESSTKIRLKNTGTSTFSWGMMSELAFLNLTPISGKLAPGQIAEITATVEIDKLEEDVYYFPLSIQINFSQYHYQQMTVVNYVENKWLLDEAIVGATYDEKSDQIFAVTESKKLLFIDPFSKAIEAYPLIHSPISIGVHPNGNLILIGNDASISHFDLSQKKIIKETQTQASVASIVFGESNWAYILTSFHSSFFSLNLVTNERVNFMGGIEMQNNSSLVRHPTDTYVYFFSSYSETAPVHAFNISQGPANYEGELTSNSEFPIQGKIWFSNDGSRLHTVQGHVFEKDLSNAKNYKHAGTLEPYFKYFTIVGQASVNDDIVGVQNRVNFLQIGENKLLRYNSTFERIEEKSFPKFVFKGNESIYSMDSEILAGFFSNNGQYFHFICSPQRNGSKRENSAIYTLKVK